MAYWRIRACAAGVGRGSWDEGERKKETEAGTSRRRCRRKGRCVGKKKKVGKRTIVS